MTRKWSSRQFIIIDKLSKILEEKKIKFTVLKDVLPFTYRAFEKEVKARSGLIKRGYNWCGGMARWGTSGKLSAIKKHYKENYGNEVIVEYVGVAADEPQRIEKYRTKRDKNIKVYPLSE